MCVCVRALLVPRPSWQGCAALVHVLGLGFGLRPATPGWGVGVCLCWVRTPLVPRHCWLRCAVFGVCDLARVSAALRHSWLGCWGVCVLVCALRLYPATPGWGVRLGCLCLGLAFGCAPPLLARVLDCVCAWCALRLCPATAGWGVRCGRVCFGSALACAPPLLAEVLG